MRQLGWKKNSARVSKPLSLAQRRKRDSQCRQVLRAGIQVLFFLLAPSLFTSAFTGLKQIFAAIGSGSPLKCTGFVSVLLVLCVFTAVFGRFFCGFACPFGALGDFMYFLRVRLEKIRRKKLARIPPKRIGRLNALPFLILSGLLLLCAMGGYGKLSEWSPWNVFSMLTAGNLRLDGFLPGAVLLAVILVGMALEPRFFCRFLCPLGAVFRLLPIFPWAVLKRDSGNCLKGCSLCTKSCPVSHTLGSEENAGNCIRCDQCLGTCPKQNIHAVFGSRSKARLLLTVGKAVLLLLLADWLNAIRFF